MKEIPIHKHCVVETDIMKHRPVQIRQGTVITASGLQGEEALVDEIMSPAYTSRGIWLRSVVVSLMHDNSNTFFHCSVVNYRVS